MRRRARQTGPDLARAGGLALGVLLDAVVPDPRRAHPVAGFGRLATALEGRVYRPSRARGAGFAAMAAGVPLGLGLAAERATRSRPALRLFLTAATTWAVLGGAGLAREGTAMAGSLEAGNLPAARARLRNLCGRDPAELDSEDLARATVESLAENASDAVVAPLLWGALAGMPGLLGYRAVNTLDAMVGYPSPRYHRFGWAAARLDDVVNLVPARITGMLVVLCAPVAGGSPVRAWQVLRRDGGRHPSPNAGRCEAAVAGALRVTLGGTNTYAGHAEHRPRLGDGPGPAAPDVRRAVRLGRAVGAAATAAAVGLVLATGGRRGAPKRD